MEELSRRERRKLAREEEKQQEKTKEGFSNFKKYLVFGFIVLAVVFVGYKIYKWAVTPTPTVTGSAVEAKDDDWVKGNKEAKLTLIEYSDFECPACRSYAPAIKRLSEENKDNLKVVYRHYPLPQHKNARNASYASEAAGKQGKFWEMHDLLFEKQDEWSKDSDIRARFETYAESLGINKDQFITDYESQEVKDAVSADVSLANMLRVNSTPTFFLNGQKLNARGFVDMQKAIDDALNSSK